MVVATVHVMAATSMQAQQVTPEAAWEGEYGLEIPVGRNCTDDEILIGPQPEPISGEFVACVRIEATGVEVAGGESAVLRAGQEIVLGDGFRVAAGASFAASIEPAVAGELFYLQDHAPSGETSYSARFALNVDALLLGAGNEVEHLAGYSGEGTEQFALTIRPQGADTVLGLRARKDDGTYQETPGGSGLQLAPGWNTIAVVWRAAEGAGELRVALNGGGWAGLTGLDNDQARLDRVRWGTIGGVMDESSGKILADGFTSTRNPSTP